MNILFCGTNLEEAYEQRIKDLSLAGNRFQNNLIRAMERNENHVSAISYISVPLKEDVQKALSSEPDVVCKANEGKKIFRSFKNRFMKKLEGQDVVIVYNVVYIWLMLPIWAKKKKVKSVLVLADYSQTDSYINIVHKLYSYLQSRSMRRYDMVIGLSKNIQSVLKKDQLFMHMEGGISLKDFTGIGEPQYKPEEPIQLMYSGLQSEVTGVDLLIEAFEQIENAQLVITGQHGSLAEYIQEKARNNPNIIYKGKLEYTQYLQCIENANILVNPRNMNLPENQNNFPSKVLEYLATGRVIVSTRFIGNERFEDNCYFSESSVESLVKTLNRAIGEYKDSYKKIYEKNRRMAHEFDWMEQAKKIVKNVQKLKGKE